jgi:hypothetical protein
VREKVVDQPMQMERDCIILVDVLPPLSSNGFPLFAFVPPFPPPHRLVSENQWPRESGYCYRKQPMLVLMQTPADQEWNKIECLKEGGYGAICSKLGFMGG